MRDKHCQCNKRRPVPWGRLVGASAPSPEQEKASATRTVGVPANRQLSRGGIEVLASWYPSLQPCPFSQAPFFPHCSRGTASCFTSSSPDTKIDKTRCKQAWRSKAWEVRQASRLNGKQDASHFHRVCPPPPTTVADPPWHPAFLQTFALKSKTVP